MTPKPTPTPSPTPAPSGSDTFGGITLTGGDTTTTTKADLFGLGPWGGQQVNPGALPFLRSLLAAGRQATADDIMKAFAAADPESKATVQHALLMGGFYPDTYTPDFGVIGPKDIAAFSDAIVTAGTSGAAVSDVLLQRAQYGAAAGIAAAQAQPASVATVNLPNTQDLEAEAGKLFQQVLGHKPTPEQAAGFASLYRAMASGVQRANNQALYDAKNPPVPADLANADPTQLTNAAQALPVSPFTGPVGPQGAGAVDENGHVVAPMTGPVAPGQSRPYVNPVTGQVEQPSFNDKVGGLMSLGQAVSASQAGNGQGLTQLAQESLPSPTVAAENYARNTDPKGAAATDMANVFDVFLGLLSKSFS